ncbi:MAG: hypothetical protein AAF411_00025 [Myxococcota bacterium]
MDVNDRTTFVQIVGQVLIADGVLGDDERAHLDRVMDELGLEGDDRRAALSGIDLDSDVKARVASLSAEARDQLVAAVERAAAADGESSKVEAAFVDEIRQLVSNSG